MEDRLKLLIEVLGLKNKEFAQRLGLKPSTISDYLHGRGNPSDTVLILISKTFNVNPEWLKTGQGEMFLKAEEDIYNNPNIEQIVWYPVVAKVGAGFPEDNSQVEVLEHIPLPVSMNLDKSKHFIVKVKGESMEPTLHDGDYIIAKYFYNDAKDLPNKKIVIVRDDKGELYVKRIYKGKNGIAFISDNPDYSPIHPNEGFRIIGTGQEVIARRKL